MSGNKIFILPGELTVSRKPVMISTLLGSCVAVCLYNPKKGYAGMNHYMLPFGENSSMKNKYGRNAILKLLEMMLRLDPDKNNIEAHIYGGGAVVGHLSSGAGIGKKNIDIANQLLAEHGIKIKTRRVGGNSGRKIFFDTGTGKIEEKMIEKSAMTKQLEQKKQALDGRKVRVLIVDDSATVRKIIRAAISTDSGIEIVGEAEDPYHAREKILELDPDVITLDIIMPKMDGITFLKKLMMHMPKPIIVVSSVAQKGSRQRMRADEIGAFDVLDKEDLSLYKGDGTAARVLVPKIKLAASTVVKKKSKEEVGHL